MERTGQAIIPMSLNLLKPVLANDQLNKREPREEKFWMFTQANRLSLIRQASRGNPLASASRSLLSGNYGVPFGLDPEVRCAATAIALYEIIHSRTETAVPSRPPCLVEFEVIRPLANCSL